MSRRTTILLNDDIYQKLLNESLRRYKTTKAMSREANELLKRVLEGEAKILDLVFSEKLAKTSAQEFEAFRTEPSRRHDQKRKRSRAHRTPPA